jgi:hypothetical protein
MGTMKIAANKPPKTRDWRLEIGGWRLEVGGWRLEVGGLTFDV